jgi:hypothetical protein
LIERRPEKPVQQTKPEPQEQTPAVERIESEPPVTDGKLVRTPTREDLYSMIKYQSNERVKLSDRVLKCEDKLGLSDIDVTTSTND